MLILYDLQKELKNAEPGTFEQAGPILKRDIPPTNAILKSVEDVRTLHITKRDVRETGIDIRLADIPDLKEGDRLTVTGRMGEGTPPGTNWSVALMAPLTVGQLTSHIAPDSVYALSHVLEESHLTDIFSVHTIGWGIVQPTMDFYIDDILITRVEKSQQSEIDTRTTIYSLADDTNIEWVNDQTREQYGKAIKVYRAGDPIVRVSRRENTNVLHVGTRVRDWDGVDIYISHMDLIPGNKYKVTVTGRIDGEPPESSMIVLQGLPGYDWRVYLPVTKDMEFTLEYIPTRVEIEKWTLIRISTNTPGASVSFYIYSIFIERV